MNSFGKRLDGPTGRRTAPRAPVLLDAALLTMQCSRPVILVDVSKTGCQLRVNEPLKLGMEVWLKIPPADIFGTVVWCEGDHCGVEFDVPFADEDVVKLQARGKVVLIPRLTPEEQLAAADWQTGMAR